MLTHTRIFESPGLIVHESHQKPGDESHREILSDKYSSLLSSLASLRLPLLPSFSILALDCMTYITIWQWKFWASSCSLEVSISTTRKPHRYARPEALIARRTRSSELSASRKSMSAKRAIDTIGTSYDSSPGTIQTTCHASTKRHVRSCSRLFKKEVANCFRILTERLKNLSNEDLNAMRIRGK